MVKRLKANLPLVAIAGVSALSLGMAAALVNTVSSPGDVSLAIEDALGQRSSRDPYAADDPVLALALQTADQRQPALAAAVNGPESRSTQRARYLLALDLINSDRGGGAIPLLEGLEPDYPALAPYIALALAQAQRAAGQAEAAQRTQQRLLTEYAEDGAIAPLLFDLGQQDPAYWDQLVQRFPRHPKAVEVAHQRLTAEPNRADALPLLMIMARAGLHHPNAGSALLRLKNEFGGQLSPDDWKTVGFGFWRIDSYGHAGAAYAQAPPTPRNLYRAARGLQVSGGPRDRVIALYNQLDQQFPDAPETATGLLRLTLSLPGEQALGVLDQVVNRFPDRAGEALLERAKILDKLNSAQSAQATRELILQQYGDSEAAASIRLQNALNAAAQGDIPLALRWGSDALRYSPDAESAADAGYWVGKWGRQLGQAEVAQSALESVIARHPDSYYAWRSAVALGWNVGDFKTVRSQTPAVAPLAQRLPLPTGSATLQELYLLGQDQRAWERWQMEYTNYQDPTPEEQFTDGMMRLGVYDNLNGIFQVSSLSAVEGPEAQAVVKDLKQRPDFWHGVYPLPYADLITTWSAERQLNPLLVASLIRQESRFQHKIRSGVGAAGLMQVMPATAEWIKARAGLETYDLNNPEDNIRLGTWYLDYTHREYDNHSLFAVASYNAGPGAVASWINRGGFVDADDFAEKIPYPETKGYVRAVFGGYWNYLRLYDPAIAEQVETLRKRHRGFRG
jgi:soluble lytic murein transglycosylase